MTQFDLPLDALRAYRPERDEPADFDAFWTATLAEARAQRRPTEFRPAQPDLRALEVFDVSFSGFGGHTIKAWLILPRHRAGPLPVVVEFIGYGGGRGLASSWLTWPAAGYASFVMDTRGQGSAWLPGDTSDPDPDGSGPQFPGFVTRGILDPARYYYRRLFTDAALAIDAAREHPAVDGGQVVISGASQGGGIGLAATALAGDIAASCIDVPFLCDFRRAIEITDDAPYNELRTYLSIHRYRIDDVFRTLSYVDGQNFAVRATTPAIFSVGLMDTVCPPSTVFAAYNAYAGEKEVRIWPYNGHEAGTIQHVHEKLAFLAARGIVPPPTD